MIAGSAPSRSRLRSTSGRAASMSSISCVSVAPPMRPDTTAPRTQRPPTTGTTKVCEKPTLTTMPSVRPWAKSTRDAESTTQHLGTRHLARSRRTARWNRRRSSCSCAAAMRKGSATMAAAAAESAARGQPPVNVGPGERDSARRSLCMAAEMNDAMHASAPGLQICSCAHFGLSAKPYLA